MPSETLAELDLARDLVGREVTRAVVDDVLGPAHAGADDPRDDHRAAQVVRDDARLRRLDLREGFQAALDLAQRHALAVDLHQIVLAARDGEAPVLVDLAQIARAVPAVTAGAADRDAVIALRQVNLRHRQHRQRLRARPDRPDLAGRDPIALRARDPHLDAVERLADGLGILARAIDGQRAGLGAVVAGQQAHAETLVEALGDARRQRRPGAEEPRAGGLERLDRGHAHQRSVERRIAREEVDALL